MFERARGQKTSFERARSRGRTVAARAARPGRRRPGAAGALPALVLAVVMVGPGPAVAIDQPGCHGNWSAQNANSRNCQFLFEAFPLSVRADTTVEGGAVRAWMTVDGYPEVVVMECEGIGRCSESMRLEGLLESPFPPQVPRLRMRCYVEGVGGGTYGCRSGV